MRCVGAYQAKTHLNQLLDEVSNGGSVIITRHGHPVAKLVPPGERKPNPESTIAALREFRRGLALGGLAVRDLIEEGRS